MANAILRLHEVISRSGLSRSTIYSRFAEGTFPAPVKLGGPRAVGWIEAEIEDWISHQVEQRQKADAIQRKRIAALRGDPAPQPE